MFLKGFICGWIGGAAIILFLLWGMTPPATGAEYGFQPTECTGCEYRDC